MGRWPKGNLKVTTEHWVEFPELNSQFSLVVYFIHSNIHMPIPDLPTLPSPLCVHTFVLSICVSISVLQVSIYTIFLGSAYPFFFLMFFLGYSTRAALSLPMVILYESGVLILDFKCFFSVTCSLPNLGLNFVFCSTLWNWTVHFPPTSTGVYNLTVPHNFLGKCDCHLLLTNVAVCLSSRSFVMVDSGFLVC